MTNTPQTTRAALSFWHPFLFAIVAVGPLLAGAPEVFASWESVLQEQAACVDEPTPACLIELALAEVDRAKGTPDFEWNGDGTLSRLAAAQAASGDLAGAARTGSRIGAGIGSSDQGGTRLQSSAGMLLGFVEDDLMIYGPDIAHLTPIQVAAQAFLDSARVSEASGTTLSIQAHAAAILALVGSVDLARSALEDAVRQFSGALGSGNGGVLSAVEDLLNAAVALGDFAKAREIVGLLSQDGLVEKGIPGGDLSWRNAAARTGLAVALAEVGDLTGAQGIAESLDEQQRLSIQREVALERTKSGDLTAGLEFVRALPSQDSVPQAESRDMAAFFMTESLMKSGHLAEAAVLADEFIDSAWGENQKLGIALTFLAEGDIPSAEAVVASVKDTGKATVFIRLALIRARKGEIQEAREVLDKGKAELANERNPARQVDFNVRIGLVLFELGDLEGAEAAIDAASQSLQGIGDPMVQFQEAALLAAGQTKLGRHDKAIAVLTTIAGGEPMDVAYGRILSAQALANEQLFEDAKLVISRVLQDRLSHESIDPLARTDLYVLAAQSLINEGRE